MLSTGHDITRLLREWSEGDESALNQLAPLIYDELCRIASKLLREERPSVTLQTTVLVHEAYIRLVEQDQPTWNGRAHFMAVAARYMRQILVDRARKRKAGKRGSGGTPAALDEVVVTAPERPDNLLALDEAMDELAKVSPEKCRMVEMHFFGGMTYEEIATVLKVHVNTVGKHLRVAEAWLQSRLT